MAWEEDSCICLNMQLIAILSRIGVLFAQTAAKNAKERLWKLRRVATTLFRNPARGAQPACRMYATTDEAVCIHMSAATPDIPRDRYGRSCLR